MHIVRKSNIHTINTPSTVISEYLMDEPDISGAVAEVNGRYPEQGLASNEISKELVYIINGRGKIITRDEEKEFNQGDVVFIDRGELFAWEGNFTMFMTTTPTFDSKQHKIIS